MSKDEVAKIIKDEMWTAEEMDYKAGHLDAVTKAYVNGLRFALRQIMNITEEVKDEQETKSITD